MDKLADRETFVAVYPNGTGRFGNRLLTWNAGACCAYAMSNNVDDVGFVRALVTKLTESIPIDRRRIYATGLSNGAMMSHRLAAEAADLIAAIAPVAGGMVVSGIKIDAGGSRDAYSQRRRSTRALQRRSRFAVPVDQEPSVSPQYKSDDRALGAVQRLFGGAGSGRPSRRA